ncbi:DUF1653 domain-containing protein [Pseudoalteromonas fenneropenaei]|uniref:DUF1653 domain-containing protein n=1 Tax=Pseudoalteromonas fenneropenaei TaxID=1737459 RepID=A0ABV7CP61_9GAMM
MTTLLKPGIYQHYKGPLYKVLMVAKHSENEELHVVYQTQYGDYDFWLRPLTMFTEMVTVDGQTVPRFRYIGPAD